MAEWQAKEKNIHIKSVIPADEIIISLDEDLINTVVRNLISNAIKFTNLGGEVIVSSKKETNEVIVCVKDNGVGIPKDIQANIFHKNTEYITQGTNNEKGTGLGLLICKDFVNLHNGRIWVKSEEGEGAEFCFALPLK